MGSMNAPLPDPWHRTSVAIRRDQLHRLDPLLKELGLKSLGELIACLLAADQADVTTALRPFADVLTQRRVDRKRAERLALQMRALSDPALLDKVQEMLAAQGVQP